MPMHGCCRSVAAADWRLPAVARPHARSRSVIGTAALPLPLPLSFASPAPANAARGCGCCGRGCCGCGGGAGAVFGACSGCSGAISSPDGGGAARAAAAGASPSPARGDAKVSCGLVSSVADSSAILQGFGGPAIARGRQQGEGLVIQSVVITYLLLKKLCETPVTSSLFMSQYVHSPDIVHLSAASVRAVLLFQEKRAPCKPRRRALAKFSAL